MTDRYALRPEDVAERWQCSAQHVRALLRRHELRGFRLGGKTWRIRPEAVEEYECRQEPESGGSRDTAESGAPTAERMDDLSAARLARQIAKKHGGGSRTGSG